MTLATTSRPYEESKTSFQATSRTEAFATPEAATRTNAHNASVEYRVMASGSRLLPRSATQPSATRPPTQMLTPTTCRNRLVVARSCDCDDAAWPVSETGSKDSQRHAQKDRQPADADRPSAGHREDGGGKRLHDECPAGRGVERQ